MAKRRLLGAAIIVATGTVAATLTAPAPAHAVGTFAYVVTSAGDRGDGHLGDHVCQTVIVGECTLRAAMAEARVDGGASNIGFNIPGVGVQRITPAKALPAIDDLNGPTVIDGTTQPGSTLNTDPVLDNAQLKIEVVGRGEGTFNGFVISSPLNMLRGMSIHDFIEDVVLAGPSASGNLIVGNFVGLDPAGTIVHTAAEQKPGLNCIKVNLGAHHNEIGLPNLALRNVISSCRHNGVSFDGAGTRFNRVRNNIVGLNPQGTARRGNLANGVDINTAASDTIVGGTGPFERNVVSGNGFGGVEISHGRNTKNNSVIGNYVGTAPSGATAPPFAANGKGVRLEGFPNCGTAVCPSDAGPATVTDNVIVNNSDGGLRIDKGFHDVIVARNRIGLTTTGVPAPNTYFGIRIEAAATHVTVGPDNEIAYNPQGIQIDSQGSGPFDPASMATSFNRITHNAIHHNLGLGIDLAPLGSINVAAGNFNANEGVSVPTLTAVTAATATGTTCARCVIEVFLAESPSGYYGEGASFVASGVASASGQFALPLTVAARGKVITATATTTLGSTSEFSKNKTVP